MQLLEKDPEKRPTSAADVVKALESIDLGKVAEVRPEEAAKPDRGPLYSRVFVGREAELKQLQSAFDGAMSGQGALMMVVGEPGIGKTAICEQISTYATLRGGKTLVGHCYEEGSLSLPYLAFVEAMRSYVLDRGTRELRKELGTGAADIARIVSEIREKLKVKVREPGDPGEERYRLMQAVTGFLSNAGKVQPLLIVLEDLHDADKGTLEMLTYITRNLGGTRLLIVGTYRDVEVDRAHPLSASLAELRRVATYDRVLLKGLNADEVQRMMNAISGQEVSWGLAETVHRQTEGNPLFVQEVLRYLHEGGLVTDYGSWKPTGQTPLEMSIPEGLRDVIGKRLSFLNPECNRILSIAAVIGREFRLEALQQVAGVSEDDLFAALEEAKAAVIVEERTAVGAAVTYRFTHAFFRQTLYEEIIAPRRIRLHQQVARVLEEVYAKRLEEHAAEMAEHFSYSPDTSDLAKAVSYGEMAAQRAMNVFAWGEAIRLLEQALKVQDVLDPEDKEKRCDLLSLLGFVLHASGQPRRALDEEFPTAFSLAEAISDSTRASLICRWAMGALISYWTAVPRGPGIAEVGQWAERLDRYAQPETTERAWADTYLGLATYFAGDRKKGVTLFKQALDLARRLDDPATLWAVAPFWMLHAQSPQHQEEGLRLAEELEAQWRAGIRVASPWLAIHPMGGIFLNWRQRQRGEEMWREYRDMAERLGRPIRLITSMSLDAILATLDGRLEDAVEITSRVQARCDELGLAEFAFTMVPMAAGRALLYLGRADEVPVTPADDPFAQSSNVIRLAYLGQKAEVVEILEGDVVARPGFGSTDDETLEGVDAILLEVAVLVGHHEAAKMLLRRLAGGSMRAYCLYYPMCIGRHLGAAAAMLGRPDDGRKYYQDALKVVTEMGFRPEVALTRLQLAELLLEHYPEEKSEALEHLDFAINEFRDMKMQPSLERALKHKEILGA